MDQNQPPAWLVPAIIAAFLIVFPAFWCFVCALISWIGGWSRLAKYYPAPTPPLESSQGRTITWRSGRVGLANYKSTLTIRIEESGLYLSVMPLFRVGHPPLFIPWDALINRQTTSYGIFGSATKCNVGSPAVATLVLPTEVFDGAPNA